MTAGELLEEGQVRGGELAERGELHDRLHVSFVQHRQHDHVARPRAEQPAAHLDRIRRDVGQQQALPIGGGLPDQPLAEAVAARLATVVGLIRVARELLQIRASLPRPP